jgi:hypothetical protein
MMTHQEMFDRAVRGLASQGFERCRIGAGGVNYVYRKVREDGFVMHCAWGWVDTEGAGAAESAFAGDVYWLRLRGIGLAAELSDDDVEVNNGDLPLDGFAIELQKAHDRGTSPNLMVSQLQRVSENFGLTWPADVAVGC